MERRFATTELRADGRQLVGHAAVWDTPARIEGRYTEMVRRGAFRGSLDAGDDVACLVDHDAGRLLARTGSGTLRLEEDTRGLAFNLDVPDTSLGRDVLELARRGDLGGCSFGFTVPPGGDAWPAADQRELHAVKLAEVSIVHFRPAYTGTSVLVRMSVQTARRKLALI